MVHKRRAGQLGSWRYGYADLVGVLVAFGLCVCGGNHPFDHDIQQTYEIENNITFNIEINEEGRIMDPIIIPTMWNWVGYYLEQWSTWGIILSVASVVVITSRWYRRKKGWL